MIDGFFVSRPLVRRSEGKQRIMNERPVLSLRCHRGNPNHHLWNNNGTWWCHLTLHLPGFQKERLRLSLETHEVGHARRLRDSLLALFGGCSFAQ